MGCPHSARRWRHQGNKLLVRQSFPLLKYSSQHQGSCGAFFPDPVKISQGDDFLRQIVPVIMASNAYKNHGVMVIWFDESESDGVAGDNPDDFNHTIGEIIISSRAHKNVGGRPYASSVNYTHFSDLRTLQNIFHVGPYLGDTANATDLSDLFDAGAVPKKP
jgi:hypothetical protein